MATQVRGGQGPAVRGRAEREAQARRGIVRAGGPVFVPAGRSFARWRIQSWSGRGNEDVTAVTVEAHNRRAGRFLAIETRFDDKEELEHSIVHRLLWDAVAYDLRFPFAVSVERAELVVPLDRTSELTLRCYTAGEAWMAVAVVEGRSLAVNGSGTDPEQLALRSIADVGALPDRRWF